MNFTIIRNIPSSPPFTMFIQLHWIYVATIVVTWLRSF